jgi:type I restriction enzyme M protein
MSLRQHLLDDNQLEAVISLPSGVFKPYAGVSTAALIFTKGGKTHDVFFYDVEADGYSLDDRRQKIEANDLPDVIAQFRRSCAGGNPEALKDRSAKAFTVPVAEIRAQKYDLSINRYRERVQEAVRFDPPRVILERMRQLEADIQSDMSELKEMM